MTAIPDQLSGRAAITDSRCGTCAPDPVRLALPGSRVWTCTGALFGSPDTVSGAAAFSPARAVSRMQGEAVERAAAWHGEPVAPPGRCVTDITPEFGPLAQRSGVRTAVRELRPEGWAATAAVDAAAVLLGTTGWFPHGSAGLASGPAGDSADCRSAPAGDPSLTPRRSRLLPHAPMPASSRPASDSSADTAVHKASATASDALAQLTATAHDLADETARRVQQGREVVRGHVGASLGVAAGVGLVAGLLFGRR